MIISDNLSVLLFREDVGIRFLCFILSCPLWLSLGCSLLTQTISSLSPWMVSVRRRERESHRTGKNETTNRMKDDRFAHKLILEEKSFPHRC